MQLWELFLLASIFFSSVNGLFHRVVMKQEDANPISQTVVFASLAGIFAFIISLYHGFHFPNLIALYPNFLLMIVLIVGGHICFFKAMKTTEASEVGIILSTQRLWTVIASFMFLSEKPTFFNIFGTILILVGVSIVMWKKHKLHLGQGELFTLFAALFYGLSYVNAFYILRSYDAPSFEVIGNFLPVLAILLLFPKVTKQLTFYKKQRNFLNVSFAALFDALSAISLYIAYQLGRNASQISPLSATSLIITVILATIFLKERNNLFQKLLGAGIVIIGAILILK